MVEQQSFDFARGEDARAELQRDVSVAKINRKLRKMQRMPDGSAKDAAAQEILDWILQH